MSAREFFFMACRSFFLWSFFELLNIRLGNWSYLFVPRQPLINLLGYALSYATVEFILVYFFILSKKIWRKDVSFHVSKPNLDAGESRNSTSDPLGLPLSFTPPRLFAAGLLLILLLSLPKYFFALTWLFPLPFLKTTSFWKSVFHPVLWTTGILSGLAWEAINILGGAKWVYHLPHAFLNTPKLFEMPLAGYLGFGIFPLCYFILRSLIIKIMPQRISFYLFLLFLSFLICHFLINPFTVIQFLS